MLKNVCRIRNCLDHKTKKIAHQIWQSISSICPAPRAQQMAIARLHRRASFSSPKNKNKWKLVYYDNHLEKMNEIVKYTKRASQLSRVVQQVLLVS